MDWNGLISIWISVILPSVTEKSTSKSLSGDSFAGKVKGMEDIFPFSETRVTLPLLRLVGTLIPKRSLL